jgi:hypothetical protein
MEIEIATWVSLLVVVGLILGSILLSIIMARREKSELPVPEETAESD